MVVFLGGLAAAWLYTDPPRSGPATAAEIRRPSIEGNFTLLDAGGQPVQWTDINRRPQLVFFGFTHCPEACPTTLMNASRAVAELAGETGPLRVTFISLDPERDSPEVVGRYAANFGPAVSGYTGDAAGIAAAAAAFHVYYEKMPPMEDGDYMVNHTAALFFIGAGDHILEIIPFGATPADISAAVRRHL